MSTQIVIDNHRTKRFLYCTQGWHDVTVADCFGHVQGVAQRLWDRHVDGCRNQRKSYAIYAAHVLQDFLAGSEQSDIDIHDDSWFRHEYQDWFPNGTMYMTNQDLDEWCQAYGIVPDKWIKLPQGVV